VENRSVDQKPKVAAAAAESWMVMGITVLHIFTRDENKCCVTAAEIYK